MKIKKIQILANIFAFLPGLYLLFQVFSGTLSANPIQTSTVITGRAAVYAILISLYGTPFAKIFKMSVFHSIRKISGLYAFYYALAHFLIFAVLDYQLNLDWIVPEIRQKPFLQVGIVALLLLIPLAVTSVRNIQRRMKNSWKKLHRFLYVITALILLHVALASKGDIIDPAILTGLYVVAMILRLPFFRTLQINNPPEWLRKVNAYLTR